jgi:phage gp36-like protein
MKMSEKEISDVNKYFFNLITMFASSAWRQLGKIQDQDPVDGNKIEKDLQSAQVTIDMLLMLRDKTKGNLTKKEEEILTSAIFDLQINYADEVAKCKVC